MELNYISEYSREVLLQKLDYVHNNPVQERLKLSDLIENYYFSNANCY
jgi:putative transposase